MPLVDLNEDDDGMTNQKDEDEDEEDGESVDGDDEDAGGISLSAMLEHNPGSDEASDDSADEEDDDDEEDLLNASDDDAAAIDDDALSKLDSFIDNLSSRKRKALDNDTLQPSATRKRRVLPERNEAGAESEFAAPGNKAGLWTVLLPSLILALPLACRQAAA